MSESERPHGRSGGGGWGERIVLVLFVALALGAVAASLTLRDRFRLEHVRTLIESDMPLDRVVAELGAEYRVANGSTPGEMTDVTRELATDRQTLVVFASRHCQPSEQMRRALKILACVNDDVAVLDVEIDRRDAEAIDWRSPVATKLKISRVPELKLYGADGKLRAEGKAARRVVRELYREASEQLKRPVDPRVLQQYETEESEGPAQ